MFTHPLGRKDIYQFAKLEVFTVLELYNFAESVLKKVKYLLELIITKTNGNMMKKTKENKLLIQTSH